ncbi:hypothetical protein KY289_006858 [Solanum tuberosum]|nr:hypothetical protein KY289_006858 [Solanum tuberosum]
MQVYKGLDIVTNKITHAEKQGVRHYLLGEIEPDSDLTAEDFCLKSIVYIENILKTQCVPIIVGGSNSYIQNFVEDPVFMFKYKYDSCFNWIDVEQSVLNRRVDTRVDEMVNARLVDEVRQIFIPDVDYSKGIRWSICVPEMASYLKEEKNIDGDDESKKMILQASISSIKREIDPDFDFTDKDFCLKSIVYIENILKTQCVPIIVGGSYSYIEKLVEDPVFMFKYKYDSGFIWIDVEQSVLNRRVDRRVAEMVNAAKMNTFIINNNKFNKKKVVFIMGATGTGKSRLPVDLATHFRGEIINSDKIQVYQGLDIVTNKITHAEKQGVRHYLLEQSVLNRIVDTRVDEMVNAGLVDQVRHIFNLDGDYNKGIRRSISVPEMASYLREEKNINGDDESKKMILQASISSIKKQIVKLYKCHVPNPIKTDRHPMPSRPERTNM